MLGLGVGELEWQTSCKELPDCLVMEKKKKKRSLEISHNQSLIAYYTTLQHHSQELLNGCGPSVHYT